MRKNSIILSAFFVILCFVSNAQNACYFQVDSNQFLNENSSNIGSCRLVNPSKFANDMYIPDTNWGEIDILVNFWVMQPEINNGIQFEDITEHKNYISSLLQFANSNVSRLSGINEECNLSNTGECSDLVNLGGQPSIDSRINFVQNLPIKFIVDQVGYENNSQGVNSRYLVDTYLKDSNGEFLPEYNNAINVFFGFDPIEDACGWGAGLFGESNNHVFMNRRFSEFEKPSWNAWDEGRLLAHEIFHSFGMSHTKRGIDFNYQCGRPCGKNESNHLMQEGFSCLRLYQNPQSVGFLRQNIYTTWRKKMVNELSDCPEYIFESDQTIIGGLSYCGDLVIPEGVTVTLRGDIRMFESKSIIVRRGGRLIINNADIYSCEGEWNGIFIEGITEEPNNASNLSGKLEILNLSSIENAKIAIAMGRAPGLPWTTEYWGGYVNANDLTIRNCRRGVAFMSHAQNGVLDQSSFTNVTFENIRDSGVTIWRSDGVKFTDCTFTNVANGNNVPNSQHEGIRAEQAWITVDNCTFNEQPYGVVLMGTDPLADISGPSSITNSDFSTEITGVELKTYDIQESSVSDGAFNEIDNNKFLSGENGIVVEERSPVKITDNDFTTSELGVFIQNGGISYENEVSQNEFMDNIDRGICFDGFNNESIFEANCFNGSLISDVDIPSGRVNESQGDNFVEAGNRYTKDAIPEIRNDGTSIDYFIWEERNPGDREYLDNSTRSSVLPSEEENLNDCGATFAPNPAPDDCASYLASIDEIMALLSGIDALITESSDEEKVEVAISLKEDLFRQLNSFVIKGSEQNAELSVNELKALMSQQAEFTIRTFVPAMSIRAGAYTLAMTELNNLTSDTEAQSDYIEAQRIYVDFLQSGREEVSSSQLAFLRTVAQKSDRLSAYARTILYIVSGERAKVIAPFASSELERRERRDSETRTFKIYPNPVGEQGLTLLVSEQKAQSYTYELTDFSGHLASTGTVTSNQVTKIETNGLSPGIYFMIIKDDKKTIIQHQKIVVTD